MYYNIFYNLILNVNLQLLYEFHRISGFNIMERLSNNLSKYQRGLGCISEGSDLEGE